MSGQDAASLRMHDLSIRFGSDSACPATVDEVDLEIAPGEIVALVGESGSGKSLLAHTIAGILDPAATMVAKQLEIAGTNVLVDGWDNLRGRRIGIVFQNSRAALTPVRRIGQQIGDVLWAHVPEARATLRETAKRALTSVRIPDAARRVDAYPGELSGGMCQRVMLALALAGNPSILIADEPTTGLDATTQAMILALIMERVRSRRMATLLITHDLELARAYAERVVVMHAGQIVEDAPVEDLFARSRHPYSRLLIGATPAIVDRVDALAGIPGAIPSPTESTPACRFADRCDRADGRCRAERPSLRFDDGRHGYSCWHPS